jgi:hypothetical protein
MNLNIEIAGMPRGCNSAFWSCNLNRLQGGAERFIMLLMGQEGHHVNHDIKEK